MKTYPRAIVDSDTARIGATDSTPVEYRLITCWTGDVGSMPACVGTQGTPWVTAGAIPVAGAECWVQGKDRAA